MRSHSCALTLCSPKDGTAMIFFLFLSFFYILEIQDHANYYVWFNLLHTTLDLRGRKII